jgi:hypothetical protein
MSNQLPDVVNYFICSSILGIANSHNKNIVMHLKLSLNALDLNSWDFNDKWKNP